MGKVFADLLTNDLFGAAGLALSLLMGVAYFAFMAASLAAARGSAQRNHVPIRVPRFFAGLHNGGQVGWLFRYRRRDLPDGGVYRLVVAARVALVGFYLWPASMLFMLVTIIAGAHPG